MTHVTYEIVPHDGGWAYRQGGVYSETFSTKAEAHDAAALAAREQTVPGESEEIEYEDKSGEWHEEHAPGGDRPITDVKD